jgi:hypothetical protein
MRVFTMVVLDEDRKTFETMSMTDDRMLNERVVKAQEAGRTVRCFSAESSDQADRYLTSKGYAQGRVDLASSRTT